MIRIQEVRYFVLLVVTTCIVSNTSAQTSGTKALCERQLDCTICINTHHSCVWCEDINLSNDIPRCQFQNETVSARCSKNGIINPANVEISRNDNFTETEGGIDFEKTVIQIRPQNFNVKLRIGKTETVRFTFRKNIDYPLDLYYVMDLSNSMKDDLEKLQSLGTRLISSIKQNVTNNFQVGFGSFVDKVMLPFMNTDEKYLQNPCTGSADMAECAPPFGFRHQLAITGDETAFVNAINSTRVSGNIDTPEGSFDALMQIAVCEEHVKWRKGSTRVVLMATDATPHVALDGKLAGILEVNDMKCHLEKGANIRLEPDAIVYARSKTMDYPSLGKLKEVFTIHKILSIFAVTKEVLPIYQKFPAVLKELGEVAELASDSSNIIPLIQDTYNKIRGRLVLHETEVPSHVTFTQRTYCPTGSPIDGSMNCDNITIGDEIVFELNFTANQCPKTKGQKDQIRITSASLTDVVTIDLEYICDYICNCKRITNSSECNFLGNKTCGSCECVPGFEGSSCQCKSPPPDEPSLLEKCMMNGSTTANRECEGHGTCDCGVCKCDDNRHSTFCECTDTGCPTRNGKLCGGIENGRCNNCGDNSDKCICQPPYYMRESDKTCTCNDNLCKKFPNSVSVCNGHGNCVCDTCNCTNLDLWKGQYCDECSHPTCTNITMSCDEERFRRCAECLSQSTDCGAACPQHRYMEYSRKANFLNCGNCAAGVECTQCGKHDRNVPEIGTCSKVSSNECRYQYQIFWTTDDRYILYVKIINSQLDCPQPINPLFIVLPAVGSIILIFSILIIMWKIYTIRRDKRLWLEWEDEEKKRKWTQGENPIFTAPENKFQNPIFDGNDD